MQGYDILDALSAIDPSALDYQQWLEIGQALHHEGYDMETWRDWSRQDAARFSERDFPAKWQGFGGSAVPVTGGTIIKFAKDAGWKPKAQDSWKVYDWGDIIGTDKPIADGTIAAGDVLEPYDATLTGEQQARAYIETLFEPDEPICYVCQAEYDEKRDKWKPSGRGVCHRTAKEVAEALGKKNFSDALGSYEENAGIWCCFNPLDGDGRNNTNVTSLRYCLVESDETDAAVCKSVFEQLNLPIAAMVFSGKKSLHAIVRVDAADLHQYNDRREAIYKACEDSGLKVDRANKNPARLSRLPGAKRGDKTQFLVSLNCGAGDFEEWQEWYEAANDDLPDCENLAEMLGDNLPKLADELIEGVLRVRHKMLISGPSKAGKSFALIQLCIALAEGREWFGFKCRQSKVLYVNLELDAASCWHRFSDAYDALGLSPAFAENIDVWNLRGMAQPMNKLLPKMVRRGRDAGYEVIVIDPIYKVMTGDENSASDMAAFANAFDRLALEVGCSVIYCHHHSKGWQDGKKSIDRASGSGVFGRDPDAILDLIELDPEEELAYRHVEDRIAAFTNTFMKRHGLMGAWETYADAKTRSLSGFSIPKATQMLEERETGLEGEFIASVNAIKNANPTAWRCEGTLREFAGFKPVNLWFDYPLHFIDTGLKETPEKGASQDKKRGGSEGGGIKRVRKTRRDKINDAIAEAVEACGDDGVVPTRSKVLERWPTSIIKKPSVETLRDWTKPSRHEWCQWKTDGNSGPTTMLVKTDPQDEDFGEEW